MCLVLCKCFAIYLARDTTASQDDIPIVTKFYTVTLGLTF